MKWDKKQLLSYLLASKQPEKILELLEVIKGLLLKYGRKLVTPRFFETLKELQPEVWALIHLLENEKMLNIAKLSAFIREFQSLLPSEQAQFNLESNDEDIIAYKWYVILWRQEYNSGFFTWIIYALVYIGAYFF